MFTHCIVIIYTTSRYRSIRLCVRVYSDFMRIVSGHRNLNAYIPNSFFSFQSLSARLRKPYPLTHQNINIDKLLLFYCIIQSDGVCRQQMDIVILLYMMFNGLFLFFRVFGACQSVHMYSTNSTTTHIIPAARACYSRNSFHHITFLKRFLHKWAHTHTHCHLFPTHATQQ